MCCRTRTNCNSCHCAPGISEHHHTGHCVCGEPAHLGRRFVTKEEKVAWLERYREGLQKEAKAVEEHISALQKEV